MKTSYFSHGKLLLSGEYLVLEGALALAIPTRFGQELTASQSEKTGMLSWLSIDKDDSQWYQGDFEIVDESIVQLNNDPISITLQKILQQAKNLNPTFLDPDRGCNIKTTLNFPRNWGLGTSSTLINNIAKWANVDPFKLLAMSFGGSGYDIAVAQKASPILYRLDRGKPTIANKDLLWDFKEELFFIHLNRKQDSKEGIAHFNKCTVTKSQIEEASNITQLLSTCTSLSEFEVLLMQHEELISKIIGHPTIKDELFSDYPHTIKSLGAWGGDFILVTGGKSNNQYFIDKGYSTILSYQEMIL